MSPDIIFYITTGNAAERPSPSGLPKEDKALIVDRSKLPSLPGGAINLLATILPKAFGKTDPNDQAEWVSKINDNLSFDQREDVEGSLHSLFEEINNLPGKKWSYRELANLVLNSDDTYREILPFRSSTEREGDVDHLAWQLKLTRQRLLEKFS